MYTKKEGYSQPEGAPNNPTPPHQREGGSLSPPMTPSNYVTAVVKTESVDFDKIAEQLKSPQTIRLLHAVMGLETEVGELMDALKKHIFYGKPLDVVNVVEECGDLTWYLALLLDELGYSYETVWERNIAKLKARYGEKFSKEGALHRNLEKERGVLEDKAV